MKRISLKAYYIETVKKNLENFFGKATSQKSIRLRFSKTMTSIENMGSAHCFPRFWTNFEMDEKETNQNHSLGANFIPFIYNTKLKKIPKERKRNLFIY